MDIESYNKLKQIDWFLRHPTLLPFVGDYYSQYRILHIGESHYLPQTKDNIKFNINYFNTNWWTTQCDNEFQDWKGWFNTASVLYDYLDGHKSRAHNIFNNVVKSFSKVILNKEISHISLSDKQLHKNFAFMNFYQMPSLRRGLKYWDSLIESAKSVNNTELAGKVFNECVNISTQVVDDVIDILKPNIVVFTSISAGNAYKDYNGKHKDDDNIIYTSHPSSSFSWNKTLKSLNGISGQEVLEEGLAKLKQRLGCQ